MSKSITGGATPLMAIIPMGTVPRPVISQTTGWVTVDISTTPRPLPKTYKSEEITIIMTDQTITAAEAQPESKTKAETPLLFSNMRVITPDGTGITQQLDTGDQWRVKLSTGKTNKYAADQLAPVPQFDLETRLEQVEQLATAQVEEIDQLRADLAAAEFKLAREKKRVDDEVAELRRKSATANTNTIGDINALKKQLATVQSTNAELQNKLSRHAAALGNPLEVKTLINRMGSRLSVADEELAEHINGGWLVLSIDYTHSSEDEYATRYIILTRPRANQPEEGTRATVTTPAPLADPVPAPVAPPTPVAPTPAPIHTGNLTTVVDPAKSAWASTPAPALVPDAIIPDAIIDPQTEARQTIKRIMDDPLVKTMRTEGFEAAVRQQTQDIVRTIRTRMDSYTDRNTTFDRPLFLENK